MKQKCKIQIPNRKMTCISYFKLQESFLFLITGNLLIS